MNCPDWEQREGEGKGTPWASTGRPRASSEGRLAREVECWSCAGVEKSLVDSYTARAPSCTTATKEQRVTAESAQSPELLGLGGHREEELLTTLALKDE